MDNIDFKMQKSKVEDIYTHLLNIDTDIIPKLSSSVNLEEFSKKVFDNTIRFEAWHTDKLIGLISVYYNDFDTRIGFINHVGVLREYRGFRISDTLLTSAVRYGSDKGFKSLKLEVSEESNAAKQLYVKHGFKVEKINNTAVKMYKNLNNGEIK